MRDNVFAVFSAHFLCFLSQEKKKTLQASGMLHMHTKCRSHNLFTLNSESRNGKHCINENRADPPGAVIFNAKIMWSSIKAEPKKPEETTDCLLYSAPPSTFCLSQIVGNQ